VTGQPPDTPISLDGRRGVQAQKATDIRRLLHAVMEDERSLRARQQELEAHLAAAPAANWIEAAEKARYLLMLFASAPGGLDPLRRKLVEAVLSDFQRLSDEG
jgi:hypothetical protein